MKAELIGSFAAQTHFAASLEQAQQGTVFVVTKRGHPVAQSGPTDRHGARPLFGSAKGRVRMTADFDAPLADMGGRWKKAPSGCELTSATTDRGPMRTIRL
jgi:antitoxin (DNA-binding transcriptional repressor) of toxin-antitoxin stability system